MKTQGGKRKGHRRTQTFLACAIARFQPRVNQEASVGIVGEIGIGGLIEDLATAIQWYGNGWRIRPTMWHQNDANSGDAIIVRGVEVEFHSVMLGAAGNANERYLRWCIDDGMYMPVRNHMTRHAHAQSRVMQYGRIAGIIAIAAVKRPHRVDAGSKARRGHGALRAREGSESNRWELRPYDRSV